MNIVFLGTSEVAVPSLRSLATSGHKVLAVVTQPDRPKGRSRNLCAPPAKSVAGEYGLRVLQPENVNHPDTVQQLRGLRPDVIVVVAYGQKLSPEVLSIPGDRCINMHASLLPKYRGAAPINWAIINGEAITGVSVMVVVERMDAGDVIAQGSLSIHPRETAGELGERLALLGAEVLLPVLERLENGTAVFTAQDEANVTYARKLKKEDGRINWNQDARKIDNLVRGMTPRPGAYTFLPSRPSRDGEEGLGARVIVLKTEIDMSTPSTPEPSFNDKEGEGGLSPTPGSIIDVSEEGIIVAAADSSICITTVQPEGRRAMSAAEFTRGRHLKPGECFDALP